MPITKKMSQRQTIRATYEARDALLRELGYESYRHYLASDLWKGIRRRFLCGKVCWGCGGKAAEVHHMEYSRAVLLGEKPERLRAVCRVCHQRSEFKPSGKRRTLPKVNNTLAKDRAKKHRRAWKPKQQIGWVHHG